MSEYISWVPVAGKTLPSVCLARIKKDMMAFLAEPPDGIYIEHEEKDMSLIHALITGPTGTPYEGGFFYFLMRCPDDYPIRPPFVKFMTTGAGTVRFNPNLYNSGKVCLSILGTWTGPPWSPAQTLTTVLVSIQSLLNEEPYHNEPGYEATKLFTGQLSKTYNEVLQHETIRVAVCGMLENETHLTLPDSFQKVMRKKFLEFYNVYENIVKKNMHLDGQELKRIHQCSTGVFRYAELLQKLQALKTKCETEMKEEDTQPKPKIPKVETSDNSSDDDSFSDDSD